MLIKNRIVKLEDILNQKIEVRDPDYSNLDRAMRVHYLLDRKPQSEGAKKISGILDKIKARMRA